MLKNIAIIAHVDHGKTTLVDVLLRQSGTFRDNQAIAERALDSNALERERGITILAKATSLAWNDYQINIVDTPGHADFGAEVERILSMVDGCLVLVDASEGPMPQTKFVVGKALKKGLQPIVVINKVDKPDARPDEVLNEVFDLFAALDADADQLDFPTIFASAKEGWAALDPSGPKDDMAALFEAIVDRVPSPEVQPDQPFSMLVSMLESDPYLGRLLTGRIESGTVRQNMTVKGLSRDGRTVESSRITKILAYRGLQRVPLEHASAGDIVAIAGLQTTTVADTVCDPAVTYAIPALPIDPPTMAMTFSVNDSPFAGQEGDKVTSRMLRDRLMREAESNVALRVTEADSKDSFDVAGRGELQLGILIETMRREGFELSVSRPRVLFRQDDSAGGWLEPVEEVHIDVDEEYTGPVVQKLSERRGDLVEMRPSGGGKQRVVMRVPTRGLIGYLGEFLTDTRGTGIMSRVFDGYEPHRGTMPGRVTGALISMGEGEANAYALFNLEDRGRIMVEPGDRVYQGMVVGEHNRGTDLEVNLQKGKQLTNFRASGKDEAVRLTPPLLMTLERAMEYIGDDELIEVTPKTLRLRKKTLDPHERKRMSRRAVAEG